MTAIEECNELLQIRWNCERRPKFLYVGPGVLPRIQLEMANMARHVFHPYEPLVTWFLFDCEVREFDLPEGFILASETRLH